MSYLEPPVPVISKTANYTIVASDRLILVDTSGGAFTLTLPDPAKTKGILFRIIDKGGTLQTNQLTLARFAAEQIEGLAASKLFYTNFGGWIVVSDGTNWWIQ